MMPPRLDKKITLGELVTILVILCGIIGFATRIEAKVNYIDDNGTKAVRSLTQEIYNLRLEMVELKTIMKEREREEKQNVN